MSLIDEWTIQPLNEIKCSTTGDFIFYVNDQELELLEKDPHVTVVVDRRNER